MTWKRSIVWLGLVLAVGWTVWAIRFFSTPDDPWSAYASAPVCTKGASASCKHRSNAAVGDRTTDGSYHRGKRYALTLRASDNSVLEVPVYEGTYDALKLGDTVEIERWNGRVTKLFRNGTEATLPDGIRSPRKGKMRAGLAALLVASAWLIVKTLRVRKRETKAA